MHTSSHWIIEAFTYNTSHNPCSTREASQAQLTSLISMITLTKLTLQYKIYNITSVTCLVQTHEHTLLHTYYKMGYFHEVYILFIS